jgi:hypothetical protein
MDPRDMAAVCNLAFLSPSPGTPAAAAPGAPAAGGTLSALGLGLRGRGAGAGGKRGAYRKREGREESAYALSR